MNQEIMTPEHAEAMKETYTKILDAAGDTSVFTAAPDEVEAFLPAIADTIEVERKHEQMAVSSVDAGSNRLVIQTRKKRKQLEHQKFVVERAKARGIKPKEIVESIMRKEDPVINKIRSEQAEREKAARRAKAKAAKKSKQRNR